MSRNTKKSKPIENKLNETDNDVEYNESQTFKIPTKDQKTSETYLNTNIFSNVKSALVDMDVM